MFARLVEPSQSKLLTNQGFTVYDILEKTKLWRWQKINGCQGWGWGETDEKMEYGGFLNQ